MTIRLRPHHLLCMLTYVGKGYSDAFVANYDLIIDRLGGGEDILLVAGPDDICTPLLGTGGEHCHNESVVLRDRLAMEAVTDVLGRPLAIGDTFRIDADHLSSMRKAFAAGGVRRACTGCEWHDLCTSVSGAGYAGVRLA